MRVHATAKSNPTVCPTPSPLSPLKPLSLKGGSHFTTPSPARKTKNHPISQVIFYNIFLLLHEWRAYLSLVPQNLQNLLSTSTHSPQLGQNTAALSVVTVSGFSVEGGGATSLMTTVLLSFFFSTFVFIKTEIINKIHPNSQKSQPYVMVA